MTYRFDPSTVLEDGPAIHLEKNRAAHSTARTWKLLSDAHRLDLVERRLRPANDRIDAFPLAL